MSTLEDLIVVESPKRFQMKYMRDSVIGLAGEVVLLESDELWFARAEVDGVTYVVFRHGFCCDPDEGRDEFDEEGVRNQLANFVTPDLKVLSEEDFLFYDEPKAFEETGVTRKFAKFLRQEYGYGKDEAEFAVWDVQGELRYAPSLKIGMISARNTLGLEVVDRT